MADDDIHSPPAALWRESLQAVAGHAPQRGAPATSPIARYVDPAGTGASAKRSAACRMP